MAGSVVEKDQAVDLNVPEWVIGDAEFSFDLAMRWNWMRRSATSWRWKAGTPLPIWNGPASP